MKNRVVAFLLALVMVLALVPAMAFGSAADETVAYEGTTFTDPYGEDITSTLTDGDSGSYTAAYGDITWYDAFEDGYEWALRAGKLIISGKGAVEGDSYPWTRFADEITEIFVFPNSVTSIGKDAFKGLNKVEKIYIGEGVTTLGDGALACGADGVTVTVSGGLTSVGAKVLDGCKNVEVVLNNTTKNALLSAVNEDNAVLAGATFTENTVKSLTVTPYVDGSIAGFENRNNVTELLTIIKDGEGNNVDLEKYSVRLLFTDGERIRENGTWVSAAMKLSDMQPSSKDEGLGLWRFNVCEAKGENQFIPQYDSSYVITVMLYDENGVLAYSGKSDVNKFKVNEEPIFEERTATPSLACQHNYVEQDLGESLPIGSFKVTMCVADRYYKYLIFATNDNTLPLSKWTLIGEKSNDVTSSGAYEVKVQPAEDGSYASYRYVRFICTYNSSNWGAHFAEIETFPAPKALKEIPVKVTLGDGTDITEEMTDNDYGTNIGDLHWYDQFDGYRWTLEDGKLIIGGIGSVEEETYPWTRFADEITEIFVFPNSVDSIGKDAFKGLDKVEKIFIGEGVSELGEGALACGADGVTVTVFGGIKSVGAKVLDGCKNVKVVLNGVTANELMAAVNEDNAVLAGATLEERSVAGLSVTPYVYGDIQGFENRNGVTELLTILKDDAGEKMDLTGYTVRLLFTDGQRIRENGTYVSSAMKLSDMQPSSRYEDLGLWRFNVCEAEGENQFIPQYDSAYVVTVMLYDEAGNLAYMGSSAVNKFKVNAEPIYDKVTATPGYAAKEHEDYVQLDFGKKTIVSALDVGFYQGDRYYQFDVYATNDPTLPLSKWDYIGEQHTEDPSNGSYRFACGNDIGEYRYFRIYGTYNSSNWALHFAEVHAYTDPTMQTLTFVVDGVATERKFAEGDIPVIADPYKNPVYGETSETFYVFLGWSDGTTLYEAGTTLPAVTGSVTYTAVFEELTDNWGEPVDPPVKPPVAGEQTVVFVLLSILCLAAVAVAGKKVFGRG
ncbi:MAG: leucine-rich repeat protein [Clostridia bacterium]|nr:leucine-rich repeat protein [Clostridia bacterium]